VRRDRVEHRAADQVDVVRSGQFGGDEVRAEKGDLVGALGGDPGGAQLVGDREAVAGLGLEVGGALGHRLGDVPAQPFRELLVTRGARGAHGDGDTACGVGLPGHPGTELGGAVAREHEVGVAVDPAGQDRPAGHVDPLVGGRRVGVGTYPGDPVAVEHHRGRGQRRTVVGGQLTDAGDHGGGHAHSSSIASVNNRPTSPSCSW
jgi:hypothetical protein